MEVPQPEPDAGSEDEIVDLEAAESTGSKSEDLAWARGRGQSLDASSEPEPVEGRFR